MSKARTDIETLIVKVMFKKSLSPEESDRLTAWRKRMTYHHDLPEKLSDPKWVARRIDEMKQYPMAKVWEKITKRIKAEKK